MRSRSDDWTRPARVPPLRPGEIHLWRARLSGLRCKPEALPAHERALAEADRRRCISRGVLRALLGTYVERPPESLSLRDGAHGKPELSGGPAFNLSHSGDWLVLAFASGGRLGVDCETHRVVRRRQALARRMFDPGTLARWRAEGGTAEGFLYRWTRLEARQKCLGEGLFGRRVATTEVACLTLPLPQGWLSLAWQPADRRPELRLFEYPPARPPL